MADVRVVGRDTTDTLTNKTLTSPALTGTPTAPTQSAGDSTTAVATTAFTTAAVNNAITGLDVKPDVAYVSTSALPANTYANGSSGVGATLTGNANGPLVIDGVTLAVGQAGERVLVAGEAAPANNGWYTITTVGVVAVSKYVLTRATESDQAAEIGAGYLTGVVAPNTVVPGANNGKLYISVAADPFTVGTTSLTFSQVGGTYTNGTGISLSGSTFSIDTSVTVDKTTAQTLTNKTLTSPVVNTPTGIVKGDVGLGNVDNTSDATKNAASVTLTNKTLTSPVLNTGVSGTAVDTDSTMAANSDTLLPSQKAVKTALALKAPLASPTFTGTVTTAALSAASTSINFNSAAANKAFFATSVECSGAMHITDGNLGLNYIATNFGASCGIDLRRTNGSNLTTPDGTLASGVTSGQVLSTIHTGGSYTDNFLVDVAEIDVVATQDYSVSTASPTHAGSKMTFLTTPNSSGAGRVIALTLGQDQSVTCANNLTIAGTISGATNMLDLSVLANGTSNTVTAALGIVGMRAYAASLAFQLQRVNGSVGSPTKILSGNTISALNFTGSKDTTPNMYTGVTFNVVSTEDWSSTAGGCKINISTTPNTTQAKAVAVVIEQDQSVQLNGNVGFYGTTPVAQGTTTAAAPAGGTGAAAGAWDTAGHRDTAIATINACRTVLRNCGLMA